MLRFLKCSLILMAYVLVLIGSKTVFAVNEGNNAVYYEATAGDAMTTSQKNYTWDNTVQEDSDTFDLQSNNYDVRLKESGRYLIMYNLPTSLGTSTNMRQEIRSGISVGGTLLEPYGTATGYNRATAGADEDNQAAATVIDHVYDAGTLTNNDVKVVWQNTDDATTKGTADSGAGLTLVKLNSDWAHSAYSEAGGNFSLTAPTAYNTYNWASITLDTNDINDGVKISHSTSSNTDDITLSDAGYYLVTYSVHFNGTGSGRSNGLTRLTLGGTEVDATRVSAYVRQRQSNNDGYASYSGIIYNSSASATLNLEATIEGEASAALDVEDVGITITKLPDNANYFRNVLSADQAVEGVESAITWPTPTEVDSLFSYSGSNSSRITIPAGVSNQDYLFFSSQYNFRSIATNGTRSIPRWRWRKNGTTIYGYGYHSAYNRGNQSSTGTFAAGSSGGFLTNLTSSDYVEIMAVDQSTTGDVAQDYKASLTGVQGVEVGSLFPTEFISVVDPDNGTGTDYTTLSAWEAAVQTDLTATTTKVFSHGGITGAIADTDSVTGASSGATADVVHATSTQILLENISGTFESGEQIRVDVSNYVTSSDLGNSAIAVAKCRSTGGSADTATVSVNGWTTDENNYVKIWTDPDDEYGRHNGKWSESKYRLENGPSATLFSVGDSYTKVEGIQISHTGALYSAFSFYNAADLIGVEISESIIRRTSATSSTHNGVSAYADEIKVYNNIIYSEGPSTGRGIRVYDFSADYYIYNNTISGFSGTGGIGILADAGTVYIMNNIVQDCDTDYSYSGSSSDSSSDYNISSDSTAPGSNSIKNTSIEFANEAGYDFHLSDSDTTARDAGTNSVFTDSDLNFYTDVDGTVRGGTPDIGADEVPVDFSSIICENTSAGGNCSDLDYSTLASWEDAVESDLTADTTRVFSGTLTGTLAENATVNLCNGSTDTNIDGVVVAHTASGQILIDGITGATNPVTTTSGYIWNDDACGGTTNLWTVSGTGDELGASARAVAEIDGAWSSDDTSESSIDGWETDNDNNIKIYTTTLARHDGKWDDSAYRLAENDGGVTLSVYEDVVIDGLQMTQNYQGANSWVISNSVSGTPQDITLSNNIFKGLGTSSPYIYNGIYFVGGVTADQTEIDIFNNIVYGFETCVSIANSRKAWIYNNTVYDCDSGIGEPNLATLVAVNNIVASTTSPFFGTFSTGTDYNATDHASDTPGVGSNNITGATFSFVSTTSGSEDFHLLESDTGAQDEGYDLSSDPYINFSTDIDGGARPGTKDPPNSNWDIGADEYTAPIPIYRSVGNDSSDLKNAATVEISGTTATFSASQPDNIGVGDVIQYGTSPLYVAFITERISDTVYTVQSSTGGTPTAAGSGTAVSVFRAYLELADWETNTEASVNSGIDATMDENVPVDTDLVTNGYVMMVACYGSDNGDDARVNINGWTTGESNYIKIYTPVTSTEVGSSQRHNGKWDNDRYYMSLISTGDSHSNISIQEEFVRVDGLQIYINNQGYEYTAGLTNYFSSDPGDNAVYFSNNIVRGEKGINNYRGINFDEYTQNAYVWNNIVYDFENGIGIIVRGDNAYVYNNTVYNSNYGIYEVGTVGHYVYNNLVKGCNDGFYGTFNNADYNISDISGDAPNSVFTGGYASVSFTDEATDNFHLSPDDTSAIGAGTDLSADSNLAFTDDVDGHLRTDWDIGADEASIDFDPTVMESSGDYSSLSAWEAGVQTDLTSNATRVFSHGGITGSIADTDSVSGVTSGFEADVVHASDDEILLENIRSGLSGTLDFNNSSTLVEARGGSGAAFLSEVSPGDYIWFDGDEVWVRVYSIFADYALYLYEPYPGTGGLGTGSLRREDGESFESGEQVQVDGSNYVTISNAGNPANAVAKIDGSWTGADTSAVTIDGWTTGVNNYVKVYTTDTARHDGKWSDSKHRLEVTTGNGVQGIDIAENYVRIDGLQIYRIYAGWAGNNGIRLTGLNEGEVYIESNIIRGTDNIDAHVYSAGIDNTSSGDDFELNIFNNIIYDWNNTSNSNGGMYLIYNGKIRVYNNTVYNCDLGYEVSPNVQLINNIAQNCDNGYANSWAFWNYTNYNNLSDLSGDAPGVDAINDATVDFVNETSDDFHLSINDLTARNRGVDLSSDSTLAFSDDVDGDIRLDGSWDIGADESPTKIYRSVGPSNTSALDDDNSHADTVSVSSGVATFSSDLPDNVGVGDAVLIDTGGTDQTIDSSDTLLFIHGRTNPTTYILRDEAGSAPSDISSNDTYEIYRAYTSLSLAEAGTKNTSIPSTFTGGNRDLVTNNEQWNIACYGDAVDTGGFTVGGWTTSSSNNIKIYTPVSSSEVGTSQRHTGLWDASSGYSISYESTGNYQSTIRIYEKHVTVDGLQISISNPSNYTHSTCITTDYITNPALISIKNSILKGVTAGETNTIGVKTGDSGAGEAHEVRISNNVIYDLAYGIYFAESGEKYIYNNTIYNCSTFGIDGGSAVVAKNNITQNCTDGFLGTFDGASDYNISDVSGDTTGISTSYRNGLVTDVIFFDEANDDFHLSVTDTSARNQGTDLSSDSNLPFWTDIDGETRAYGAAWDIGADEFTKATTLFKGGVNVTGGTRITN